jgi:TolA-binding protein
MNTRFVAAFALALSLAAGAGASAEPSPSPAPAPSPNSAVPGNIVNGETVQQVINAVNSIVKGQLDQGLGQLTRRANETRGEVSYFRRFEMQVKLGRDSFREIHLHQGTIINPRGATIRTGDTVTVSGDPQNDGSLNANSITIIQ